MLVPLLYGGLYLWSNWDPYGKLDQIPVAVVNSDEPVTVNGQEVNAGKLFVDELKKDRIFDWHFVDRAEAARGVEDSDYYFEISVPSDFSKKLASGADSTPQRARMLITLDDGGGYIVGKMAQTVQSQIENKISAAAVSAYFQSVFDNLESLRNGLASAVDGAGQLRDGLTSAEQGSASLSSGIGELKAGADKLAPGAQQVADGVSAIADVVVPAANTIANALPSFTQDAANAAAAADSLAGTAAQTASSVAGGANSVQSQVTTLGQAHPELQSDPAYQELVRVTGQAAGFANQVNSSAAAVKTTTASVNGHAQQLAQDAPRLQSEVRGAATKISAAGRGRHAGGVRRGRPGHRSRHGRDRRDLTARRDHAAVVRRDVAGRPA